jgi:class 3 adenylate cyclase
MNAVLEKMELRFPTQAEELRFQEHFADRAYPFIRWVLLLALVSFASYGVFDLASPSGGVHSTRFRFMIACPIIACYFAASFSQRYRQHWRILTGFGIILTSILVVIQLIYLNSETDFRFDTGTITLNFSIVMIFTALFPLTFIDTLIVGVVVQLIHGISAVYFIPLSRVLISSYLFHINCIFVVVGAISYWRERLLRSEFRSASVAEEEKDAIRTQLLSVASLNALERAANGGGSIADAFGEVTVLFCDIVDFTGMAERFAPKHLVEFLSRVFESLDDLAMKHSVEKVKTIGDSYMAITGTTGQSRNPVEAMADFALDAIAESKTLSDELEYPIKFRIGMDTGSIIGGVIERQKMLYDYWGKTVNIANRLESSGLPGRVQVSEATYWRLHLNYELETRDKIDLKGVGTLKTYFLNKKLSKTGPSLTQVAPS